MKTKIVAALVIAMPVFAVATTATAAEDEVGFYVTAGAGSADTRFRPSVNDVVDDDDTGFDIGVGYSFSEYVSVHGGYHDFGSPTGFAGCPPDVLCIQAFSPEKVDMDGWSATVNGALPINNKVAVTAKIGFMSWDASARSPSLNDSDTDLYYGVGLRLKVTPRWGVQVMYEEVNLDIESLQAGAYLRF